MPNREHDDQTPRGLPLTGGWVDELHALSRCAPVPPEAPPEVTRSAEVAQQLADLRAPADRASLLPPASNVSETVREMWRMSVARAYGIPPSVLGLGPDGELLPGRLTDEQVAAQVEQIVAGVVPDRRHPEVPPPVLRLWRPFGSGDAPLTTEQADLVVTPASGHGRIEGPMQVYSLLVDLSDDPPEFAVETRCSPNAYRIEATRRTRMTVRLHVRAWDPWSGQMETVGHRDAILGLCLAVVRHGLAVVTEDPAPPLRELTGPAFRPLPRSEALRWARQVAEIARFLPVLHGDGRTSRAREMAADLGARTAAQQRPRMVRGSGEVRDFTEAMRGQWADGSRSPMQDLIDASAQMRVDPEQTTSWREYMLTALEDARRMYGMYEPDWREPYARAVIGEITEGDQDADRAEREARAARQAQRRMQVAPRTHDEVAAQDPEELRARIAATLAAIDDLAPPEVSDEPFPDAYGGSAWDRSDARRESWEQWAAEPARGVAGPPADPAELERRRAKLDGEPERDLGWLP